MDNNNNNIDQAITDDDDVRLFTSQYDTKLAKRAVRIKHNDARIKTLKVGRVDDLDRRIWRRLGCLLGQNTRVKKLCIPPMDNLDLVGLCAGIQSNRSIEKLDFARINLQDSMSSLAPFLSSNPSLKSVDLDYCKIGTSAGIDILSTALINRSHDTLEELNLNGNDFGDIDLDQLVLALNRNTDLRTLNLVCNEIGQRGCASLAKLLSNRESNLEVLDLTGNSIDSESVIILINSLAKNNKLKTLELGYNIRHIHIPPSGWAALLKCLCNTSSINDIFNSNHTLENVMGMNCMDPISWMARRNAFDAALGIDNANLLFASIYVNGTLNRMLVARRKILWSHARGNVSIGDSSIATGAMPTIISWFQDNSNIRYDNNDGRLGWTSREVTIAGLDSVYRLLRSRPSILQNGWAKERERTKRKSDEMKGLRDENKELREEIKRLKAINGNGIKNVQDENKRLKTMLQAISRISQEGTDAH